MPTLFTFGLITATFARMGRRVAGVGSGRRLPRLRHKSLLLSREPSQATTNRDSKLLSTETTPDMKTKEDTMKRLLLLSCCALLSFTVVFSGQAKAGTITPPPAGASSGGESSPVLACFYECKEQNARVFREITSLVLANASLTETFGARIGYFDGNENLLAHSQVSLSPFDLDEINICRTLQKGIDDQVITGVVPQAGLIMIVVEKDTLSASGVYAWVKDMLGTFKKSADELNPKHISKGIGKTECRVVPVEASGSASTLDQSIKISTRIDPIFIEDTGDNGG